MLVSVHEVAKKMGLKIRRVQQLAKAGIIPKDERGKYHLIDCLSQYVLYLGEWRADAEIPCNADDLARYLGLTPGQVRYLANSGIFQKVGIGRFDLATCIKAYLDFVRKNYSEGAHLRGIKAPWQCPDVKGIQQEVNFDL